MCIYIVKVEQAKSILSLCKIEIYQQEGYSYLSEEAYCYCEYEDVIHYTDDYYHNSFIVCTAMLILKNMATSAVLR